MHISNLYFIHPSIHFRFTIPLQWTPVVWYGGWDYEQDDDGEMNGILKSIKQASRHLCTTQEN